MSGLVIGLLVFLVAVFLGLSVVILRGAAARRRFVGERIRLTAQQLQVDWARLLASDAPPGDFLDLLCRTFDSPQGAWYRDGEAGARGVLGKDFGKQGIWPPTLLATKSESTSAECKSHRLRLSCAGGGNLLVTAPTSERCIHRASLPNYGEFDFYICPGPFWTLPRRDPVLRSLS